MSNQIKNEPFLVHEENYSFKSKIYYYGNKYKIETAFEDKENDKSSKIITQNQIRHFDNPRKNIPQEYNAFFDSFGSPLPKFSYKCQKLC